MYQSITRLRTNSSNFSGSKVIMPSTRTPTRGDDVLHEDLNLQLFRELPDLEADEKVDPGAFSTKVKSLWFVSE